MTTKTRGSRRRTTTTTRRTCATLDRPAASEAPADRMTPERQEAVLDMVRQHFDAYISDTPGLESLEAQAVIFAACVCRLAADGFPLPSLLQIAALPYGVELEDVELRDQSGNAFVHAAGDAQSQRRPAAAVA